MPSTFMNYELNELKRRHRLFVKSLRGFHILLPMYYVPTFFVALSGRLSEFYLWNKVTFFSILTIFGIRLAHKNRCALTMWEYKLVKKKYKFKKLNYDCGYFEYLANKHFKMKNPHELLHFMVNFIILGLILLYFVY